jgi:Protein of unknown function C-terminus (DUF2399)
VKPPADRERLPDGRPRIPWAEPSSGVRAVVELRRRGDELVDPVDRRGRLRSDRVLLVAATPPVRDAEGLGLSDADWRFVVDADRREWSSVTSRFKGAAAQVAMALAEAGVVELLVPTGASRANVDRCIRWYLSPAWVDRSRVAADDRSQTHADATARAAHLAAQVRALDPGFAAALLDTAVTSPTFPVLTAAAADLVGGVSHDGPRAFSQTHFGHTKARDDAPKLLRAAGVSEDTLDALGLRRSPYVGIGGPVTAAGWDAATWPGPVRLRVDPHRPLPVVLHPGARALLLVENLQAAETVCDTHPDVGVVWFAGQPADTVLAVCAALATSAADTGALILVAPDADLGGVRIAARVLTVVPKHARVQLIDVGDMPHTAQKLFPEATLDVLHGTTASGPHAELLTRFADAVATRGYPVEQEAVIRAALRSALGT